MSDGCDAETQSRDDRLASSAERKYQKKLLYNDHLPYARLVEEEGNKLLDDIKTNLSLALQKSELWPGTLFWTNRLGRYALLLLGVHSFCIVDNRDGEKWTPSPSLSD